MQQKFITVLLLIISQIALAQPSVETKIDSTNMMIGEQMKMELQVKHSKKTEVLMPKNVKLGKNIEVLSQRDSTSNISKEEILTSKKMTITSFDSGVYEIPPIPISVKEKNGNWDTIFSKAMQLTVVSPVIDSTQDFAPIKDIFQEPMSFKEDILPGILAVLGVAVLITLVWLYSKRQKKDDVKTEMLPPEPEIPAHILAFSELKKLDDKQLWQNGNFKMYHSEISHILREYLENRFKINALESVTDEIMTDLKGFEIDLAQVSKLKNVLQIADLVKFAKVEPSEEEHRDVMDLSLEFVQKTQEVIVDVEENNDDNDEFIFQENIEETGNNGIFSDIFFGDSGDDDDGD
ncbi:MAG: BatD family protein [Saprospiraceae bacterium]